MRKLLLGFLGLGLLLAGCSEKPPVVEAPLAGPELVSVSPENGVAGVTGNELTVTLIFNQNVKSPSSQHQNITIDNGAAVSKVNAFNEKVTVDIASLEENGQTYTLVIPEGTILGFKENQNPAEEIRYTFTMKYVEPYVPAVLDPVKSLVNPNASQQAKNVYAFLLEQSGKKTLSGVQSSHCNTNDFVDAVHKLTGKHPALAGYDFLFLQFSPTPEGWSWVRNYNDISAPKEQWQNNGLVNYMWHWNVPDSKAAWDKGLKEYDFDGYSFYTEDTSFDIREALKSGTWQNEFIMKDIEEVAGYLQLLEDENIPVIWRPLHEAAGNFGLYEGGGSGAWFWWGNHGPEPCRQLWRLLYDQLVNVYGLDNLIWVWTADIAKGHEARNLEWYPGDEYVDIVSFDVYEDNTDAKTYQYQALLDMTGGRKLVTVSECGNIPDPAKCMQAGNKWSWFMVWPSADSNGNIILTPDSWSRNTADYWKKVMSSPYVMNREQMPNLK